MCFCLWWGQWWFLCWFIIVTQELRPSSQHSSAPIVTEAMRRIWRGCCTGFYSFHPAVMGDFIGHSESHDRAQLQGHIHLVPGHSHLQKYLANGTSENHNVYAVFGGGGVVAKPCPTLATPWTVACQAPLSMGFSRQEYWRGLPFHSPGGLPNPGIEPGSPALQADSLPTELQVSIYYIKKEN